MPSYCCWNNWREISDFHIEHIVDGRTASFRWQRTPVVLAPLLPPNLNVWSRIAFPSPFASPSAVPPQHWDSGISGGRILQESPLASISPGTEKKGYILLGFSAMEQESNLPKQSEGRLTSSIAVVVAIQQASLLLQSNKRRAASRFSLLVWGYVSRCSGNFLSFSPLPHRPLHIPLHIPMHIPMHI